LPGPTAELAHDWSEQLNVPSLRGIPGLKSEIWGTLRVFQRNRLAYWSFAVRKKRLGNPSRVISRFAYPALYKQRKDGAPGMRMSFTEVLLSKRLVWTIALVC
jgi:hypothetical protein